MITHAINISDRLIGSSGPPIGFDLLVLCVSLVVYGALLLIDLMILFLTIRLICRWRDVGLLVAFDTAGRPVVQEMGRLVGAAWQRLGAQQPLSEQQRLWLALAVLVVGRLIVVAFV